MLTEEKVLKNTEKYFKTGEKYEFMTDELMELLGQDFISAPASTATNLHNAFSGGLIAHLLLVTKYAVSLNAILPESLRVDTASLIKVSLLHQIGKAKLYKPLSSKWHNDRGIMYEFNEELVSMRIGERSAHYATSNGVSLTEEEYQAILNHDKDDSDKQAKWHSTTLAVVLKQANELAILEEKSNV
jgi:23S rRNA maturation-related 3'-5' exoribonuclease YhaM